MQKASELHSPRLGCVLCASICIFECASLLRESFELVRWLGVFVLLRFFTDGGILRWRRVYSLREIGIGKRIEINILHLIFDRILYAK